MKKVYLDYAATSPVKKEVLRAMEPYHIEKFGNPSSIHLFGQEARHAVDEAREKVAKFLNCAPSEIIFTSGGTEADNLALLGLINGYKGEGKPHIITSQIEHHAILDTCEWLEKRGLAEITYLPVTKDGLVQVEDIEKAIKENTILVSIMYVNNEVGTVQPIREIGKMIQKCKMQNAKISYYPVFHADAVQAIEYQNCDVQYLHVDMLTLSGHKFGAPKGIGALFVRKGVKLEPIIHGGGQEFKIRSGTENVSSIVGLGKAISVISHQSSVIRIKNLRNYMIEQIEKKIPNVILNGSREERNPNNVNFSFLGIEGEGILLLLDEKGIAVSTGSACASGSLEPSHVLMAMGHSHAEAHGSVRFTLGEETTMEEIDYVLEVLPSVVEQLRERSPFANNAKIKNQKSK